MSATGFERSRDDAVPAQSLVRRADLRPVDGAGEARHRNRRAAAGRAAARHSTAGRGAGDQSEHGRQGLSRARARGGDRAATWRRRLCLRKRRGEAGDRQASRRPGHRRRSGRQTPRPRRHRRGDPAVVRGGPVSSASGVGNVGTTGSSPGLGGIVADAFVIETVDLRKHYAGVEAAARLESPGAGRAPSSGFSAETAPARPPRSSCCSAWPDRRAAHARVFGLAADAPDASVAIRRRTGFVSDEKDLYDYMTVEEMIRFTARFFPALARRPRAALSADVRAAARTARSRRCRAAPAPGWRCCWRCAAAPSC